jgi:hypothetical protein
VSNIDYQHLQQQLQEYNLLNNIQQTIMENQGITASPFLNEISNSHPHAITPHSIQLSA